MPSTAVPIARRSPLLIGGKFDPDTRNLNGSLRKVFAMKSYNRPTVVWALEELSNRDEQSRLWLSDGSSGENILFHGSCLPSFRCRRLSGVGIGRSARPNKVVVSRTEKFDPPNAT